jgi:hypothetical protein
MTKATLWVHTEADGAGLLLSSVAPMASSASSSCRSLTRRPRSTAGAGGFAVPAAGGDAVASMQRKRCVCRKCLALVYASQSERSACSALRRADAIRRRLGGTAYEIDPAFPPKPLRMRWYTYEVLRRRYKTLLSQFLLESGGGQTSTAFGGDFGIGDRAVMVTHSAAAVNSPGLCLSC